MYFALIGMGYDLRTFGKWINKPRTIRIKKLTIIITAWALFATYNWLTNAPKTVYREPARTITPITLLQPIQATTIDYKAELALYTIQNKPPDSMNLYEWGNCTYFVASQIKVPQNLGNANTWAYIASTEGYPVSNLPLVGAVAVSTAGYYGHVALVKAVENGQVLVAEMNVLGLGVTDEQWYPVERFTYVYFG